MWQQNKVGLVVAVNGKMSVLNFLAIYARTITVLFMNTFLLKLNIRKDLASLGFVALFGDLYTRIFGVINIQEISSQVQCLIYPSPPPSLWRYRAEQTELTVNFTSCQIRFGYETEWCD